MGIEMTQSEQIAIVELPCPAEMLVPHRPPMLLIDRLIERKGDMAVAEARVPQKGPCVDVNGYDALLEGKKPNDGFLVGIDDFSWNTAPLPNKTLQVKVEKTFEFGVVKIIRGEVLCNDVLLAKGEIKVWENKNTGE
jgi:3-hydroxymyristoyl/3-hydroxydecanoyl-(acyl carrier protein) dehydratase